MEMMIIMMMITRVALRMKRTNASEDLSIVPSTEEALGAEQLLPHSGHFKMKGMTHHSLKPEKLRILSETEPALPSCMHETTWSRTGEGEQAKHPASKEAGRQRGTKTLVSVCWVQTEPGGDKEMLVVWPCLHSRREATINMRVL